MEDKNIIKALECCGGENFQDDCPKCPLNDDGNCNCRLAKSALNLINRQQAEIESLRYANNLLWSRKNKNAKNFIEKLKQKPKKEFNEKLKRQVLFYDEFGCAYFLKDDIDNLAKEKTEKGSVE